MKGQLQQAQQIIESLQNPLKEAEEIKAQGMLIAKQADAQIKIGQLQEDSRQFDIETAQKSIQKDKELALRLTELESKVGQQLDAEVASNMLVFDPATGDFVNASR